MKNSPSEKKLKEVFGVDDRTAEAIKGVMIGNSLSGQFYPYWVENEKALSLLRDIADGAQQTMSIHYVVAMGEVIDSMIIINDLVELNSTCVVHGVEHMGRFAYLNTGETYKATLFYDTVFGRFFISCMGDVVEKFNVK